jgi:hypothetical protein
MISKDNQHLNLIKMQAKNMHVLLCDKLTCFKLKNHLYGAADRGNIL